LKVNDFNIHFNNYSEFIIWKDESGYCWDCFSKIYPKPEQIVVEFEDVIFDEKFCIFI